MMRLIEGGDYTAHRPGRFPLQTFDELNDPSKKRGRELKTRSPPSSPRPLILPGGPFARPVSQRVQGPFPFLARRSDSVAGATEPGL